MIEHKKADTPVVKDRVAKTEPPVQEYPKMLYHPDGRSMTVGNAAEEAQATTDGFKDTPQPAPEAKR